MGAHVVTSDIERLFPELGEESAQRFPGGKPPRRHAPSMPTSNGDEYAWDRSPVIKIYKGEEHEFFTVGALADALGVKPVTVRKWESEGKMPRSRYRGPTPKKASLPDKANKGRRLYTRSQIRAVIDAAKATGVSDKGNHRPDWKSFTKRVVDDWKLVQ